MRKHATAAGDVPYTAQEEIDADIEDAAAAAALPAKKAAEVRDKRDRLLRGSDHSQLPDSPADKPAYVLYRLALRNLPNHANFPDLLPGDWPVAP